MTPYPNAPLGFIEQILLVVFMLMLFVAIAGGNPSMVLKPLFEITGQLVGTLLSLLCTLIVTLFRTLLSLIVSGVAALAAMAQSANSRNINR